MESIRFYFRNNCAHSQMMLAALKKNQVKFELLDVSQSNSEHTSRLKELANGYLSVPTLEFPDGEVLVEPGVNQCIQHISIKYPDLLQKPQSFWQNLFKKKGQS